MRLLKILVPMILVLGLMGISMNASGYARISGNPYWSKNAMPVEWKLSEKCSSDLSFSKCYQAMQDSFDTWSNVSCSYMQWQYGGTTTLDSSSWGGFTWQVDGVNLMVWEEKDWPNDMDGAIAVTAPIFQRYGVALFQDTDIMFNGVDFIWGVGGEINRMDVANIATHEIGHALGLDHSSDRSATMYYATSQGITANRSLAQDDINGICAIYPLAEAPDAEVGDPCGKVCTSTTGFYCATVGDDQMCTKSCSEDSDCPDGYLCRDLPSVGDSCWPAGSLDFGLPCRGSYDCMAGLVCLRKDLEPSCTYVCPHSCPDKNECQLSDDGISACFFKKTTAYFGEDCSTLPCDAGLTCVDFLESTLCTKNCDDDSDCEFGTSCADTSRGEYCWPTAELADAKITSFSASPVAPCNPGTHVRLQAVASSPRTPLFEFSVQQPDKDWEVLAEFSETDYYLWTPMTEGTYGIRVRVKDRLSVKDFDDEKANSYLVTETRPDGDVDTDGSEMPGLGDPCDVNHPCLTGLNCSKLFSVQRCASPCTQDSDCPDGYRCADTDDALACWEDRYFTQAVLDSFSGDISSPVVMGNVVTFTAFASAPNEPFYSFWIMGSDGQDVNVQPYSMEFKYHWMAEDPGIHFISVQVKDSKSKAQFDDKRVLVYEVANIGPGGDFDWPESDRGGSMAVSSDGCHATGSPLSFTWLLALVGLGMLHFYRTRRTNG